MPLTASVSPAITTRFREVQDVLSFIRQQEHPPPAPDALEVRLLRGLFYVHLYGAFEFSVNRIVSAASQAINAAQVPHSNVAHSLGTLVLDRRFKAMAQVGRQTQWQRRLDLINLRISPAVAQIDDGCIDLQNIWFETLREIFAVFGITKPVMFDQTKIGYIREVVEARNKVAHGEQSPLVFGSLKRSPELQATHDVIRDEAFYVLDCFNDYLTQQTYKLAP